MAALYETETGRPFGDLCAGIDPLDEVLALDSQAARRLFESCDELLGRARISGKRILVCASKNWEQLHLRVATRQRGLRKWIERTRGAARLRDEVPADA